MRWGNPNAYGGLDLLGSFGVKRSRGAGTEADRQHRLALEGGLKNQRGKLETAIFATRKRMNTGIGGDTSSDVGWSLSAEVIGLTLESLVKKRVLSDPEQSRPWTWTVGAEIDVLRLMAGRGFSEPWFALAKIEAEVGDIGNETVTDYQTMLSAGLRF